MALGNLCRIPEAIRVAETAEEAARLQGLRYQLMWALWQRAQMLDVAGRPLEAQLAVGECLALIDTLESSLVTRTGRCNLAAISLDADPRACMRAMETAGGAELGDVDPVWATFLMRAMVLAALGAGEPAVAGRWATRLEARATRLGLPAAAVRAETARAALLHAAGDHESAARLAVGAAGRADAVQAALDAVAARIVAGPALAAAGRRDDAVAELERAAAAAIQGGALKLRDAAARELRRLGARVPAAVERAAGPGGLDALTPREREIAGFVAAGHTNRQIAATLFLSEKTVENHLSRLFAKVGVRSRVELAALTLSPSTTAAPAAPRTRQP
jgi:DNA-binding NarL/FixJ family response regulator